MPHHTPLIATIVAGLVLAFIFAAIAVRLRVSPLIGYLAAGVVVGPFTPGYVADQSLANELAEMGVILLMFGVGLHFSVRDLLSVRKIAIPGALVQIGVATLLGMGLAFMLGWSLVAGIVFGLALSVASTVVLLRALQERKILDTERGKIAVGWLIVEDLVMVLALVLIPAMAAGQGGNFGWAIGITVLKVAAFFAFMLIVGRRVIPWALHEIAHTGSRELFRLAVLAIALGVAFGAAKLFGVSFALGAFFAGMILAESPFSQRAAQETLPLRDAFAVLFFVSVGMLFNPNILFSHPVALAATVAIIILGKSIAAYFIVRAFGRSHSTGLVISASLAQIGEFSFILATLGASLALLPPDGRNLILAGAIITIMLNPFIFALIDRFTVMEAKDSAPLPAAPRDKRHIVLVGYGRVGNLVGKGLLAAGEAVTVIETENDIEGLPSIDEAQIVIGNAADPHVLVWAELDRAKMLFVAIPDTFEAGQIVEQARAINAELPIVARAHSDEEVAYLTARGATRTIMGEREIAQRMIADAKAVA
ncbi:YbaL family putative K(+) efflux transporter [Allosphingosinicella vermicomposti]|uniref:YbaL family putative K(+) efflux transporter n=1 Tax=Allosphingosinicella vermicomposti TaxID=614671 RepID=UPI000D109497|nr:YbaL family putative K(+) efflux transporter [Allosphingosinicella vermicomposti]